MTEAQFGRIERALAWVITVSLVIFMLSLMILVVAV